MGPDAPPSEDQRSLITLALVSLPGGSTDTAPMSSRSRTAGLASLGRHRAVSTRTRSLLRCMLAVLRVGARKMRLVTLSAAEGIALRSASRDF